MKFFAVLAATIAAVSAGPAAPINNNEANVLAARAATTACNANNCARQVTGTRTGKMPDVTARQADCSSFQTTISYTNDCGALVTVVTPTAVPTYASDCTTPVAPTAAYASACSCWGITQGVTTLPIPVITLI